MTESFELSKIGLEWGYQGEYGPLNWCSKFPHAAGNAQSPIDIQDKDAVFDQNLTKKPLKFFYDAQNFTTIVNTGSSFKISGLESANSGVVGGAVQDEHKFLQFHMHWGKDGSTGSEHLINGKCFAGELHFVNWNRKKYSNDSDAISTNGHDGLVVLGVLVNVGEHNSEFDKILNCIDDILLRDGAASIKQSLDVKKLFPSDVTSYWTYDGSLTTPPCTQCVKWIVFRECITLSDAQLAKLRQMYICKREDQCCEMFRIKDNFRPVCDLNGRKILKSFN
ncbi:carbonic anhydrase [Brachionus plicatilis]|uniref:Carbonic anhydrase n=1 Tax=Brachionus plicatilis TaxID=10195 RepID=A0A3M7PWY8_BRAPC|nr:carbonic anhydrase [Brachionus plicatilis]